MSIQAVFFDMGGTVQTFWHTPELRLKAMPGFQKKLTGAGIHLNLDDEQLYQIIVAGLDKYHAWSMRSLIELPVQRVWCDYILADFIEASALAPQAAEDLMLYIETNFYHREMRPEIPVVLHTIQRMDLKIGLISNVCSRGQVPADLDAYGIRQYFSPIVLSSEYGRRKPDPAIFHYAARLAQVPTSACVYVGDRINRDIVGAKRAGFRLAVQIQHHFNHGETDEGATPDVVIEEMIELIEILRREQSSTGTGRVFTGPVPAPVRAILFDAGDILYHRPTAGHKLQPFLFEAAGGVRTVPTEERAALDAQAFQGTITQDEFWEGILRAYGVTEPGLLARGKEILEEEGNAVEFFPGVRDTLIALKESGFLLGIISDTAQPISVKLQWFEKGGFGHVWDTIISSKEMKVCKPDPKVYQAALEQLGVSCQQAVFVGHKTSELDGARAVGIHTIAFNYEPGARADYTIEKFSDLVNVPLIWDAINRQEQM